ncbi:MAG: DNA replication and repair protein RecF [Bradymonadia bacterium]
MQLERVSIRDVRNLAAVDFEPHPGFNVFAGANGQGKTNVLGAVYWMATLRPMRGRVRELIRWGEKAAQVSGIIQKDGLDHRLQVRVDGGQRTAQREDKTVKNAQYFGALSVVLFTPDDVGLVRGPPADRRKFLDRAIFTGQPGYLAEVLSYRRALDARNALLRDGGAPALFDTYEEVLANHAARLIAIRRAYLDDLAPRFKIAFAAIADAHLGGVVRYRESLSGTAEELREAWATDRGRDRVRGFTQRGPHVDDVVLRQLDRPAKAYASQGQQRAMVLALKIAEIEALGDRQQITPVLLLDDVSSELDPERNRRLFEFLGGFSGQVFITTTDTSFLKISRPRRVFAVQDGRVEQQVE